MCPFVSYIMYGSDLSSHLFVSFLCFVSNFNQRLNLSLPKNTFEIQFIIT